MKAAEFINDIFSHLGYDPTDEHIAPVVAAMAAMEIPDEVKAKFHSTFMTEDVAKVKLRPAHRAEAYSQIEQDFLKALESTGQITKEEYSEIVKGQEKLADKLNTSLSKLKEKLAKATKGGDDAHIAELKKQIDDLKVRIEAEKVAAIEPYQTELSTLKSRLADQWERGEFGKLPVHLPEIAKIPAIKAAINAELESLGGEYFYDVNEGKVKLHKKGDKTVPLYLDNKEADWNSILSSTITKHFTIADPNPGGTGGGEAAKQTIVQPKKVEGVEGKLRTAADSVYASLFQSLPKT